LAFRTSTNELDGGWCINIQSTAGSLSKYSQVLGVRNSILESTIPISIFYELLISTIRKTLLKLKPWPEVEHTRWSEKLEQEIVVDYCVLLRLYDSLLQSKIWLTTLIKHIVTYSPPGKREFVNYVIDTATGRRDCVIVVIREAVFGFLNQIIYPHIGLRTFFLPQDSYTMIQLPIWRQSGERRSDFCVLLARSSIK
jgi:hypothetical protein